MEPEKKVNSSNWDRLEQFITPKSTKKTKNKPIDETISKKAKDVELTEKT